MTQVCEPTTGTSGAQFDEPPAGDGIVADQLSALDLEMSRHPADVRPMVLLAVTAHSEAIATGVPPERELARLRELGARRAAARGPLDPVLAALHEVTDNVVEATLSARHAIGDTTELAERVRATGTAFVQALLTGFQEGYAAEQEPRPSGSAWDRHLHGRAASNYAVVAVHCDRTTSGDLTTVLDDAFTACGVPDAVPLVTGDGSYVLVPARDEQCAVDLCRQVHQRLGGEAWLAVSWCSSSEVDFRREEAHAVLNLVRDGARQPGVYQLDDVLVEYAVLQDPSTVDQLTALITPVLRQDLLHATLKAFITANGNRSKAADALKIHRSTLDYRLGRIEQLTGCQPTSDRGVQLLAIALATCAAPRENTGN
ncbi:PucR family transcriptional regulator [Lentzea rhizosphaerae]|uniref:PucR family transcriptional regulator n=1 Tax=Lentzea rhizosphaerae TaxID=2041025 RepID=A0ABV8C1F9_9PSEU